MMALNRPRRLYFRILPMIAAVFFASQISAWGQLGHRVVAGIAERHLTPRSAQSIHALMQGNSLASMSTWSDEYSFRHPEAKTSAWHYLNFSDEKGKWVLVSGQLKEVINKKIAILKDRKHQGFEQTQQALRWLVHLLGDAHQPLHLGYAKDRGGNTCYVLWYGKMTKLHAVWDRWLIMSMDYSYTELIDILEKKLSREYKPIEKDSFNDWLLVDRRSYLKALYPKHPHLYCSPNKNAIKRSAMPKLGYAYYLKHRADVERSLYHGGMHLAFILNDIFDSDFANRKAI
jgi:hypothetical protein